MVTRSIGHSSVNCTAKKPSWQPFAFLQDVRYFRVCACVGRLGGHFHTQCHVARIWPVNLSNGLFRPSICRVIELC